MEEKCKPFSPDFSREYFAVDAGQRTCSRRELLQLFATKADIINSAGPVFGWVCFFVTVYPCVKILEYPHAWK